ncbi:hypothetical protein BKA69DRAFT_897388 [Paraphysoderma sedebokerense]|nr:hypothetical protein BKA69DRAFT_897388 [Paraphysoderma sedebokerense]
MQEETQFRVWCLVLVLLLSQYIFGASAVTTSPWYLKDYALSPTLKHSYLTILDAAGNSSHLYVLDENFYIWLFRYVGASGNFEYVKMFNNYDWDGVSLGLWTHDRGRIDVKIDINPYNTEVYITQYTNHTPPQLRLFRYSSTNVEDNINSFFYQSAGYFSTIYQNPYVLIVN